LRFSTCLSRFPESNTVHCHQHNVGKETAWQTHH